MVTDWSGWYWVRSIGKTLRNECCFNEWWVPKTQVFWENSNTLTWGKLHYRQIKVYPFYITKNLDSYIFLTLVPWALWISATIPVVKTTGPTPYSSEIIVHRVCKMSQTLGLNQGQFCCPRDIWQTKPGNILEGLPRWFSGKESTCQWRRHRRRGFNPWVGKIAWGGNFQSTPVFLPGEFHGERNLAGYVYGIAKSWTQLSDSHFQEKKEESCRKSLNLLREHLSHPRQNADGIRMVKAILTRFQIEMRNVWFKTKRKAIFAIQWQRSWLNCVHVLVFCGR